jgi:predicted LPLAT superfamily acyltransferase
MTSESHWAGTRDAGSLLGMRVLVAVYRIGGVWLFRFFLAPVVCCYALLHSRARRASRDYRWRMHRFNPEFPAPRPWHFIRHLWNFAVTLLDKLRVWMGDITREDVVLHNSRIIDELLSSRQGALILISHLGNFEVCQALSESRPGLRLTSLRHTKKAEKFNRILREFNSDSQIELLQVTDLDISAAIRLNERISAGEFIAIAADRIAIDNGRTVVRNFLGYPACFPLGPFALATALQAPVVTIHCIKVAGRYHIHFEYLWRGGAVARTERHKQQDALINIYVERLEYFCQEAPWQWYNFFPFWEPTQSLQPSTVQRHDD